MSSRVTVSIRTHNLSSSRRVRRTKQCLLLVVRRGRVQNGQEPPAGFARLCREQLAVVVEAVDGFKGPEDHGAAGPLGLCLSLVCVGGAVLVSLTLGWAGPDFLEHGDLGDEFHLRRLPAIAVSVPVSAGDGAGARATAGAVGVVVVVRDAGVFSFKRSCRSPAGAASTAGKWMSGILGGVG